MVVNSGCHQLILDFGTHKFPTQLVILESQGLDVILGMDWMTAHKGVIDCANRSITLTTPEGKRIRYKTQLEPKDIRLNYLKGVRLNHLKEVSLHQVSIVREYPDVFLDELPGMPPDRDVEFLIYLLPGTGPIAKRPYPLSTDELKELKKQLGNVKKILEKITLTYFLAFRSPRTCFILRGLVCNDPGFCKKIKHFHSFLHPWI